MSSAGLAAAGYWWLYPVLWLLPLVTWYQLVSRIRNIAEHAVVLGRVQQHAGKMVPCRVQPPGKIVKGMGHPGQGMPVGGMDMGERPNNAVNR